MKMGIPALRVVSTPEPAEPLVGSGPRPLHGGAALMDQTDAELVQALVAGERNALEKLYRRHAAFAFRIAVRLQGNAQDMEDVVHDAFLKAHRRIRGLKEPSAFRAWLGSIVVNEVRIRLRRTRLMRVLRLQNAEPVDLDALASSDASPEVRAQLAQVYGLLRLMPTDERIAWTLRFVERHRLQDVAQLSECSLATAKRRLTGAQRFLDEHYVRGTPYAATDRDSSDSDSNDRDSSDRDSTRPGKLALTRERP